MSSSIGEQINTPPAPLLWQPGCERTTWYNFDPTEEPEGVKLWSQAFVDLPGAYRALPGNH